MKRILAFLIVFMFLKTTAFAMPVRGSEGALTLTCTTNAGNVSIEANEFQLLGIGPDGKYLIFANGSYYSLYMIQSTMTQTELEQINKMAIVREADIAPLSKGARGAEVEALQQFLISAGCLRGAADGDFGGATEIAVKTFQASMGLEQTGVADARLRMLIDSIQQPELVLEGHENEAKSEQLEGLEDLYAAGLTLDYDDISGVGFMSDGSMITKEVSATSDIDKYTLNLQFGFYISEDGENVAPAVQVTCLCMRRPVIEEITLKSGKNRGTAKIKSLNASLNGIMAEEHGIAILGDKMVEILASAAEAGELKVRISGRYNSFDLALDKNQLASVAKIGELGKGM